MKGYFHDQTITSGLTLTVEETYRLDLRLFLQGKTAHTSHTNSTFFCDLLQMQSPVEIRRSALKNITFLLFNSQFEPALQLCVW